MSRSPKFDVGLQGNLEHLEPPIADLDAETDNDERQLLTIGLRDNNRQAVSGFQGWSLSDIRQAQEQDSDIGPVLDKEGKPKFNQISHWSLAGKSYWSRWNRLEIRDGVLVRQFWSNDGSHSWLQIVLPKSLHALFSNNS